MVKARGSVKSTGPLLFACEKINSFYEETLNILRRFEHGKILTRIACVVGFAIVGLGSIAAVIWVGIWALIACVFDDITLAEYKQIVLDSGVVDTYRKAFSTLWEILRNGELR